MRKHDVASPLSGRAGRGLPALALALLVIGCLVLLGVGARYGSAGEADGVHTLFSVYFSINLLICDWEMCLFF